MGNGQCGLREVDQDRPLSGKRDPSGVERVEHEDRCVMRVAGGPAALKSSSAPMLRWVVMSEPPDLPLPSRIALADPAPFLAAVTTTPWIHEDLDGLDVVEMWALVALCALSRREREDDVRCDVYGRGRSGAGRFAHAVGFDAARDGQDFGASQEARTVAIQRVSMGSSAAAVAERVARLAVPSPEDAESRGALAYVIDELLRNVLQHSADGLGAVVGAQRIEANRGGYTRPTVQVTVVDTGKGILESLRRFHEVPNAQVALEKAIRPHVSGTFAEGQTGSIDNAGLGLFFTSEMAKLTAGRFLLATRGAALLLTSDEDAGTHRIQFLPPPATGFPGTLAVFELPLEIQDRDALLQVIRKRASDRMPASTARSWLAYGAPKQDAKTFLVRDLGGEAADASALGEKLRATLSSGDAVVVDFTGIEIATQSFLHALLFHAVRVGWAMNAPIHVLHASSAVRSGLDYLESYALK